MKIVLIFFFNLAILSVQLKKTVTSIDFDGLKTLHQALIHMMFECRKDIYTVIIYDEHGMFPIDQLSFTERPISIIYYDNKMINSSEKQLPSSEIDAFIVFMSYETQWKETVNSITKAFGAPSLWKAVVPFYVIDGYKYECYSELAVVVLYDLYKYNAITDPYFICYETNRIKISVFTLNPYDRQAPRPWAQVNYNYPHNRVMVFRRNFNSDICRNLYFNRMLYLKGYQIVIAVPGWTKVMPSGSLFYNKNNIHLVYPSDRIYIETLAIATKMKIIYKFFSIFDSREIYDVMNGCDFEVILLTRHEEMTFPCYEPLYPIEFDTFNFVTHNKGIKTPLERIRDYYGIWTLVSMIVLLILTYIVILIIKKDWSFAGFEVLRLLINSAIEVELNNLFRKIFFSMIFLYFLVFHATFSGHLAEFLTQLQHRKNPETVDELADDIQYTEIMSPLNVKYYLSTHPIHKRLIPVQSTFDCLKKIFNSESTACFDYQSTLHDHTTVVLTELSHSPFHIPKNSFGYIHISIYGNKWSSKRKYIETIYLNAKEAGLVTRSKADYWSSEKIKVRTAKMQVSTQFRALTRHDLQFGFIIFGVGIIISNIVFIAEMCLIRYCKPKARKISIIGKVRWNCCKP